MKTQFILLLTVCAVGFIGCKSEVAEADFENVLTEKILKEDVVLLEEEDFFEGEQGDTVPPAPEPIKQPEPQPPILPGPPVRPIDPIPIPAPLPEPHPEPIIDEWDVLEPAPISEQQDDEIVIVPEVEAEFPGGVAKMFEFIQKNLKYPDVSLHNEVQGRVYCSFVIEKNGTITNIEVLRGISVELDQEAVRLIKSMPNWKPAENRGKICRSKYTLPITYRLE